MESKSEFEGKRILITGASKGIGRDCCILFKEYGAVVIGLARDQEALKDLQQNKILDEYIVLDLNASPEEIQKKIEPVENIDYLVNNAGVSVLESFLDTKPENFDLLFNVNVRSVLIISQIIARKMISAKKAGAIVNVSSVASTKAIHNHTSYCTSKGALDQLTRMMALELGPQKIRVNAINPTVVLTDMGKMAWSDPEKSKPVLDRIPLGRFVEERECSNAIAFLLSSKAAIINGITMPIEGGLFTN